MRRRSGVQTFRNLPKVSAQIPMLGTVQWVASRSFQRTHTLTYCHWLFLESSQPDSHANMCSTMNRSASVAGQSCTDTSAMGEKTKTTWIHSYSIISSQILSFLPPVSWSFCGCRCASALMRSSSVLPPRRCWMHTVYTVYTGNMRKEEER